MEHLKHHLCTQEIECDVPYHAVIVSDTRFHITFLPVS